MSASKRDRCAHVSRSGTRESFSVRRGTDCCGRTRVDEGTCTCDLKSVRKTNEQKRKEGRQWKEALLKAPDTGECIRETGGAHRPSEDAGVWSGRGGGSRYADLIEDGCNAWRCSALRPLNPDSRGRAGLRSRAPTPARPQSARTGRKHTHEFTDPRNRAGYLHAPLSHMMQNACVRARACSTHGHAGNTSDSATAHGRTAPAIEGAATQATRHTGNAFRDRQHDSVPQLCLPKRKEVGRRLLRGKDEQRAEWAGCQAKANSGQTSPCPIQWWRSQRKALRRQQ